LLRNGGFDIGEIKRVTTFFVELSVLVNDRYLSSWPYFRRSLTLSLFTSVAFQGPPFSYFYPNLILK
jgi:hypothetical protein